MDLSVNRAMNTETLNNDIVISWSPLPTLVEYMQAAMIHQTFNLTISSSFCDSWCKSVQLSKPYLEFTAPDGAPICEFYNFSVTATYVGAIYTGDGCSVPSSIHKMLPSLPDIKPLQSSLKYTLMLQDRVVTLKVFFKVISIVSAHRF